LTIGTPADVDILSACINRVDALPGFLKSKMDITDPKKEKEIACQSLLFFLLAPFFVEI